MDFLKEVRNNLDLPLEEKEQVMAEIGAHYAWTVDELKASGRSDDEADAEAGRRMGDPGDIARRMQTVHLSSTWKTALLTALPFLGVLFLPRGGQVVVPQALSADAGVWARIGICFVAMLILVSLRELGRDRRPVWLATWLAGSVLLPLYWAGPGVVAPGLPEFLLSHLQVIVLCVLAAWAWRPSGWKWILLGLVQIPPLSDGLSMAAFHLSTSGFPWASPALWFIDWLLFSTLWVGAAVGVFWRHRYSNTAQSSLFLYTWCAFAALAFPFPVSTDMAVFAVLSVLALGMVGIPCARASSIMQKRSWLALGLLGQATAYIIIGDSVIPKGPGIVLGLYSPPYNIITQLLLVIVAPVFIEFLRSGQPPEMAVNQTTAAAGSSNSFLRAWSDWLRELRASANQRIHAAQGEWISKARRSFDLVRNSDYALAALIALTWSVIFGGYIRPSAESTERVSVSSSGEQGNNESGSNHATSVSADGRYVAFSSKASNLVPNDTNSCSDVFVRDRLKGVTERVSVSSAGAQGGGDSLAPAISADGKYVAFQSSSGNFVAHDANGGAGDVFVRDRQTGTTELISVSSSGEQGSKGHGDAAISADGRFVAFRSDSPNLVPGDTNETEDVFVRDRKTRTTQRVSVSSTGEQANDRCGGNGGVAISADGRFVVFDSFATNLVPGDTNGQGDFFIHDRQTGVTQRVSLSSTGGQSDSGPLGDACSVSADGRFVVFASNAQTLVKGYSNCNVFIRDRKAKTTQIISVPIAGGNVNAPCVNPSITPDGRYVVFCSLANNLVPGDTNGLYDTFVRDRQTGVTRRVSVASDGAQGNAGSGDLWWRPSISADGKVVAFSSDASNLVREDTNRTTDVFVRCLSLAAARPRRPR